MPNLINHNQQTQLYLSLSAYGGVTTREALTTFWQAGIRHVELAIGPKPDADASLAIRDFQQLGMVYRAHHAFVWESYHTPFNLAERFDYEHFVKLTDWLADYGITAYSVHGGNYRNDSKIDAYAKFIENIYKLHLLCQERDIILGVETMYAMPPGSPSQNLLDNSEDIKQFCKDAKEIKLVVDLAHLNIWHRNSIEEKLEILKILPQDILEIHISDNDGMRDIHSPITDKTWWLPWIEMVPVEVPLVLESRMNRLQPQEINSTYNEVIKLFAA